VEDEGKAVVTESYFQRVRSGTPTRLWVNNPTLDEVALARSQEAVGCTTNPAYAGGLLRRAPEEIQDIVRECAAATSDDLHAAELVQERLVARVAGLFMPLFSASGGREGFVSIQGSPETDMDADRILQEGLSGHAISANATPKIPATVPGFHAFEQLVGEGIPTIVTEVFSLDQLRHTCEVYVRITGRTGVRPPFFISPITGILADHLKRVASEQGRRVDDAVLDMAGVLLARRCQRMVEEHAYPVTLLFGGARTMQDFTGLVGAATASTINYSTVREIIAADPVVSDTIHAPDDEALISELSTFDDFRRALSLDSLDPQDFASFGPVLHFRDMFVAGWRTVVDAIGQERRSSSQRTGG
jgi:transaldolase